MRKLLPMWITVLTIVGLLTQSVLPVAFAQEGAGADDGTTASNIYLPLVRDAGGNTSEQTEGDEADAGLTEVQGSGEYVVAAQRGAYGQRALPDALAALRITAPVQTDGVTSTKLHASLQQAQGRQRVVVRLSEPSLGEFVSANVNASARDAQLAQLARVSTQQATIVAVALQLDSRANVLAQMQKALNAVVLEVDASVLAQLAANPAVASVRPVRNYEKTLDETVPYIGATAVQTKGYSGAGVSVAVLDSGIDYLHTALGGAGDPAEYAANDPTLIEPDTFPTAKVVGGYDFVGSNWSGADDSPLEEADPDPLDDGPEAGHGTHVADIIAGTKGVAPAAALYAVKVCSSVSTSCSGIALLQGMDFALDPNGDSDISDALDVVNMSLGSSYGNAYDDDLSYAVQVASAMGVIVVASAGNSSDKPYVHGSPASAPAAIAVAQTNVPSAVQPLLEIVAPASIAGQYPAIFQSWSVPLTALIEGPMQYGDGAGGNLNGCAPFAAGSLAGKIVLVDRGACNFSLKIANVSQGGALAGIIGLVAPGDPFDGGDGGDRPIDISGFMISQAVANAIKSNLGGGVIVRFDPAAGLSLVQHMVGSSSRGPAVGSNLIKPDIGAPGSSISAIAGSGDQTGPFGGTSGAAPMVSGAVALLRQAYPDRSVAELKALLMNTAETQIMNLPAFFGGDLAAITRIGGGEVRVDRALAAPAAAWDEDAQTGSLSFTFHDVTAKEVQLTRIVNVRNYSDRGIWYEIEPTFRFKNDADTDAVDVETPDKIFVPAKRDAQFTVKLTINGRKLRTWALNSGAQGANPAPLTELEYDGYLNLIEDDNVENALHLAWHLLPRKAGDVSLTPTRNYIKVRNRGVGTTAIESYTLLGVSANLPEGGPGDNSPWPDWRYFGYATFAVPAGVCNDTTDSFVLAFAANTWERQTHANAPASYDIYLDVNGDGTDDYEVFTFDLSLSGSLSDGRNLTWVADLATGNADAFFFTDHETNSANTVMLLCAEQLGLTLDDALSPIKVTAYVYDSYFVGQRADVLHNLTIAPFGERYVGQFDEGGFGGTTLTYNDSDKLRVVDFGPVAGLTDLGLLLLNRGGAPVNREASTVVILP